MRCLCLLLLRILDDVRGEQCVGVCGIVISLPHPTAASFLVGCTWYGNLQGGLNLSRREDSEPISRKVSSQLCWDVSREFVEHRI